MHSGEKSNKCGCDRFVERYLEHGVAFLSFEYWKAHSGEKSNKCGCDRFEERYLEGRAALFRRKLFGVSLRLQRILLTSTAKKPQPKQSMLL